MLGGGVIEMLGVASILPLIAVLSTPEVVQSNGYLKWVFDSFGFSSTTDFMRFLALIFMFFLVLALAYRAFSIWILSHFTQMREYSIGHRLIRNYLLQPYDWFLKRHSADLAKTIMSEVSRVVGSILIPLVQLVVHSSIVVSLLALLLLADYSIALTLGITFIVSYAAVFYTQRSSLHRIGLNLKLANERRFRVVNEAFGDVKSAKVSGLEAYYAAAFAKPAYEYASNIAIFNLITQTPRLVLEFFAFGSMLAIIFWTLDSASFQEVLPMLSLYALASYRLLPALQQVYLAVSAIRVATPVLDGLHAELATLAGETQKQKSGKFEVKKSIRLDCVSYRYPGSAKSNISNLNLTINTRSSIGVVGQTGSGKTTLIDIVLGLLQPSDGRLLVDGCEINATNRASWQNAIGYVPQHIFLIDDSVAANIAYGVPNDQIDRDAVVDAARVANLDAFILNELPQGYDTMVGERGIRLSGGQIQRIGIARAVYRKPALLVLDEATSALDNLTESVVMEAISNLGNRLTIIVVAHRLSTVRICDCIYVMENGRVSDSGNFNQLINRSGRFRDLAAGFIPELGNIKR